MSAYNFFGPYFEALVGTDGDYLSLTPNGADPNLPIADSLEFRATGAQVNISVTLKPHSRGLGLALMGDPSELKNKADSRYKDFSEYIKFGNILQVKFGYSSDPTHSSGEKYISGLIGSPDVSIGTSIEITINAVATWFPAVTYDAHMFGGSDDKLPEEISPIDAIGELCKKHGFDGPFFQTDKGPSKTVPDGAIRMKEEKRSDLVQPSNINDWEFMRMMCYHYGARPEMLFNKDSGKWALFICSEFTEHKMPPIAKFVYGSQTYSGDVALFPILGDITAPNTGMFLGRKGNYDISRFLLSKKKEEEEFKPDAAKKGGTTVEGNTIGHANPSKNVKDSDTGITQALKSENKGGGGRIPAAPRENKDSIEDKSQADILKNSGLEIEFDTVGVPTIINTNEIIQVEIGKTWLSGNYRLSEVTHRIDSSGYRMHVKANAVGLVKAFLNENMAAKSKFDKEIQEHKGDKSGGKKEAKKVG